MGRAGSGVEVRENSIRIAFQWQGSRPKMTLTLNGEPLPPTPANVKYAVRLAKEIRDKIRHGTFVMADYFPDSALAVPSDRLLVGVHLDNWIGLQITLKPSTRKAYKSAIESFWKKEIGQVALADLVRSHILGAIASRPNWTGKTRNNKISVLRGALDLAVADKIIAANPCDGVESYAHQRPEPDPFILEEAEAIIAHFRDHWPEQVWNYFEHQFFTGLRTNEGLGLEWDRASTKNMRLHITRGLVLGEMTDSTKTSKSRYVDLNSRSAAALERQKKWSLMAAHGRVFTDPRSGEPWLSDEGPRENYWRKALKRLGIRYRDPYHTRHTYATLLIMSGAKDAYIARQLGHSVSVLYQRYGRWVDSAANGAEMAKLESAIAPGASLAGGRKAG